MNILHGIRVLNLSLNLPGPAAARRLHQLGASVTKLEPPTGDPMEQYHGGWYRAMATGQTLVRCDLKSPEGRSRLQALLAEADLLITATRPAALARLGLDWQSLHGHYPDLCQVAIVGYPAPRDNEAGHDLTYQAALGLLTPPLMPRTLLADMAGAGQTVASALALLLGRERGMGGGYAEVALSEAVADLAEPLRYGTTVPGALLGGGVPEYNIYKTSEAWVAVAALEPHFKSRLEDALGVRCKEEYEAAFLTRNSVEWEAWGRQLDIPIVAITEFQQDSSVRK
jgi:crotonobetainyl-CoA:carnitine CoA-transferase CaiB-like acyl-CoA transferase